MNYKLPFIFAVALLLGCTGVHQDVVGQRPTPDDEPVLRRTASVRIVGADHLGHIRAFCSGVVVHQHLVVTAGHCVKDESLAIHVLLGRGQATAVTEDELIDYQAVRADQDRELPVETIVRHPQLDLAVVVIAGSLNAVVTPADENTPPVAVNEILQFNGYGLKDGHLGNYREGKADMVYPDGDYIWVASGADAICMGDSGGGVFRESLLVGIIVAGSSRCSFADKVVLLSPVRQWIFNHRPGV